MISARIDDNGHRHASASTKHSRIHAWRAVDGCYHVIVALNDAGDYSEDFTVHVAGDNSAHMTVDMAFKLRRISGCPEIPTNAMIQDVINAVIEVGDKTG